MSCPIGLAIADNDSKSVDVEAEKCILSIAVTHISREEKAVFLALIDFETVTSEDVYLKKKKLAQEKKREEKVVAWVHGTGAAKPTGQTSSALHIYIRLFTDHITIAIVRQTHTFLSGVQLLPGPLSSVHDASTNNGSIKTFY